MQVKFLDESSVILTIDSNLYSIDVIHKCFYWLCNRCTVDIQKGENCFEISLTNIQDRQPFEKIVSKVKSNLIDFKTRELIYKETKNIREMLIAKAFAHEDDLEEPPPGNLSDPIGFNPSLV
ncbi:MAG: His-Xaa-Ser system protein HxsD [Candidatus Izemoplasmatales bacterium]|nr:His-Xaa-Ser system protein HxsD [Candidatus Izemoplasmatales bacterium]